jgi:hypothetical protein
MALYYPGCSTTIPNPQCSDCPTRELSDVRSIFFVKNDFAFTDITDTAEWTTGITNEDIYVFPYTKGTVASEPNMVPGFGDQEEYLDGYTFTAEVQEPNYAGNFAFWNAVKNSRVWKFGYRTESKVHLSDVSATIVPTAPIAEGKKTAVVWNIMVKWTQDDLVEPFDMPTGVFEQCIDVS